MDRRAGLIILGGVALATLLAAVTTAGSVRMWDPPRASETREEVVSTTVPEDTLVEIEPEDDESGGTVFIANLVALALLAALVVLTLVLLRSLWPRLRWARRRRIRWRDADPDFETLPDVASAVADDAAAQQAALQRGSPRNAIVACWLRLEQAVAASGLEPDPAETSAELTARVLGAYHVDRDAIVELSGLYREARFSEHVMGEESRARAVAALARVHDGLRERVSDFA